MYDYTELIDCYHPCGEHRRDCPTKMYGCVPLQMSLMRELKIVRIFLVSIGAIRIPCKEQVLAETNSRHVQTDLWGHGNETLDDDVNRHVMAGGPREPRIQYTVGCGLPMTSVGAVSVRLVTANETQPRHDQPHATLSLPSPLYTKSQDPTPHAFFVKFPYSISIDIHIMASISRTLRPFARTAAASSRVRPAVRAAPQ